MLADKNALDLRFQAEVAQARRMGIHQARKLADAAVVYRARKAPLLIAMLAGYPSVRPDEATLQGYLMQLDALTVAELREAIRTAIKRKEEKSFAPTAAEIRDAAPGSPDLRRREELLRRAEDVIDSEPDPFPALFHEIDRAEEARIESLRDAYRREVAPLVEEMRGARFRGEAIVTALATSYESRS
jgi:hypothetical protein